MASPNPSLISANRKQNKHRSASNYLLAGVTPQRNDYRRSKRDRGNRTQERVVSHLAPLTTSVRQFAAFSPWQTIDPCGRPGILPPPAGPTGAVFEEPGCCGFDCSGSEPATAASDDARQKLRSGAVTGLTCDTLCLANLPVNALLNSATPMKQLAGPAIAKVFEVCTIQRAEAGTVLKSASKAKARTGRPAPRGPCLR